MGIKDKTEWEFRKGAQAEASFRRILCSALKMKYDVPIVLEQHTDVGAVASMAGEGASSVWLGQFHFGISTEHVRGIILRMCL